VAPNRCKRRGAFRVQSAMTGGGGIGRSSGGRAVGESGARRPGGGRRDEEGGRGAAGGGKEPGRPVAEDLAVAITQGRLPNRLFSRVLVNTQPPHPPTMLQPWATSAEERLWGQGAGERGGGAGGGNRHRRGHHCIGRWGGGTRDPWTVGRNNMSHSPTSAVASCSFSGCSIWITNV